MSNLRRHADIRGLRPLSAMVLLVAVGLAGWLSVDAVRDDHFDPSIFVFRNDPPPEPGPTTLIQAWDIAASEIESWNGDWAITSAYSTDVNDTPTADSGQDGRRRTWQFDIADGAGNTRLIRVTDGVATDGFVGAVEEGTTPGSAGVSGLPRPTADSDEVVSKVVERYPQLGGANRGEAVGFHFFYGPGEVQFAPLLTVLGQVGSSDVMVRVRGTDADILEARKRTLVGGPLRVSTDAGNRWSEVDGDGVVVRFDSRRPKDADPLIVSISEAIRVYEVGEAQIGKLVCSVPIGGEPWVYDVVQHQNGKVVLSTTDGLFVCEAGEHDSTRLAGVSEGVWFDLDLDLSDRLHAIRVVAPEVTEHLALDDDGSWTVFSDDAGAQSLQRVDGLVVAVSDDGILLGDQTGRQTFEGASGADELFLAASGGLYHREKADSSWQLVRDGLATSLVTSASPVPVIAAAFFREGVHVTMDEGETWAEVLPARREPWKLARDASGHLYAIQGVELEWVDY